MKVRLGITSPMGLPSTGKGRLALPHFLERNFLVAGAAAHSVWLEASRPLSSGSSALKPEQPKPVVHALRGMVQESELNSPVPVVWVERAQDITLAWSKDPHDQQGARVVQTIGEIPGPGRVRRGRGGRFARHGSLRAGPGRGPQGGRARGAVILAGDAPQRLEGTLAEVSGKVAAASFEGGQDNVPALLQAWDTAAAGPGRVIVWIHGPQPVILSSAELLRQAWERRPEGPALLSYQVPTIPEPGMWLLVLLVLVLCLWQSRAGRAPCGLRLRRVHGLLLVQAAAFWPVWRWHAGRLQDGTGEVWGLLSLVTGLAFYFGSRGRGSGEQGVLVPALLTALYAVLYPFLPRLGRAILAVAALSATLFCRSSLGPPGWRIVP